MTEERLKQIEELAAGLQGVRCVWDDDCEEVHLLLAGVEEVVAEVRHCWEWMEQCRYEIDRTQTQALALRRHAEERCVVLEAQLSALLESIAQCAAYQPVSIVVEAPPGWKPPNPR